MPSPFPGMDPYLEHPELWPDAHHGLIESIRDALSPRLRPKYRVAIEKRTYIAEPEGLVDVVHEGYLEVRAVAEGNVVTALEILSPSNKRTGEGRRVYELKRRRVLTSSTHLVEIDLLRGGEPMPFLGDQHASDYRILVSRSERRPRADLYAFRVRDPIPAFPLPLLTGDEEPRVELQSLLNELYDRAGYDLAVDYRQPPTPPLQGEDAAWAENLLQARGLR